VTLRLFLILFWTLGLSSTLQTAAAQIFDPNQVPFTLTLEDALFEVSGLAVASDTSVFAHNDEHGIIYEISVENGDVRRIFALGDPTIAADFEGIASSHDRIYLITSNGILYEGLLGDHQSRVRFNAYDTGVGSSCEVEGLSKGPRDENGELSFLILCKSPRQPEFKDRLTIFKWNLSERLPVTETWLSIDRDNLLRQSEQKRFKPSGLHWQADTGHLFIISGGNRQFLLLDKEGEKIANYVLSKDHHRQTEGVVIMPNGALVFADEGSRKSFGTLSVYNMTP